MSGEAPRRGDHTRTPRSVIFLVLAEKECAETQMRVGGVARWQQGKNRSSRGGHNMRRAVSIGILIVVAVWSLSFGTSPARGQLQLCGGIAGIPCPVGFACVDDPRDACDPQAGGEFCGGICVSGRNKECVDLCRVSGFE